MHVAIYLPLFAAAVLGASAAPLSRALPPATATRLLAIAGALTAAATSFVLAVLAFTLVAELSVVARLGDWSTAKLDASNPVPDITSLAAGAAGCVLAVLAVLAATRRVRSTVAARRLCAELGGGPGDLVVVDGPEIEVFAVSARRGRIVASRPLLSALPADERRAMLAHESAHLRHHHHSYRLVAELAAVVNPLLRPLGDAVEFATERWADEAAACVVGDRAVVARALARLGLHGAHPRRGTPWAAAALHALGEPSRLVRRVEALLAPAPRHRPLPVAAIAVLLLVTMGAVVDAQRDTERMFENASVTSVVAHGPRHLPTTGAERSAPSAPAGDAIDREVRSPQEHSL
jgi:Zn-dependent protease with chaperone function